MRKTLKNLALIAIILAIVFYITQSWDVSVVRGLTPDWSLILVSCLILSLHFVLVSILSYFILTPVTPMSIGRYIEVYFITQLGRYIPGKIWLIVGKIELLKKEGFSKTWIASTSFLELFLMIVGAGLVTVFSVFQETALIGIADYKWLLFIFGVISCIVILGIKYLWKIVQCLSARLKLRSFSRMNSDSPFNAGYMMLLTVGYTASWVIQGIAFACLVKAFFPEYDYLFYFMITYAFAWIVGFLSLFAPAGLGVKESMIIVMLNQIMQPTESIVVALITRIWSSAIEVLLAGMFVVKSYLSEN